MALPYAGGEKVLGDRVHASVRTRRRGYLVNRALYVASGLLSNLAAPVLQRLRGPGALGIDRDIEGLLYTLRWFANCLADQNEMIEDKRVVELGPGRTCEVLVSFVLAGAASGLGLDTSVRVSPSCAPESLDPVAGALVSSGDPFLRSVGASRDRVAARRQELVPDALPLRFAEYGGGRIPLADNAVDLIVSKSVLEHVALRDVEPLVADMRRVLAPGGTMVHVIDLRDHMAIDGEAVVGDWLDALTYSPGLFEAMTSRRPISINRLRAGDWQVLFEKTGFEVARRKDYSYKLPNGFARDRLKQPWRSLDDRSLAVGQVAFVCR